MWCAPTDEMVAADVTISAGAVALAALTTVTPLKVTNGAQQCKKVTALHPHQATSNQTRCCCIAAKEREYWPCASLLLSCCCCCAFAHPACFKDAACQLEN